MNNTKCLGSDGAVHVEGHTENDARITQPTLSYTPARENCKPARSTYMRARRSARQHEVDACVHADMQTSTRSVHACTSNVQTSMRHMHACTLIVHASTS